MYEPLGVEGGSKGPPTYSPSKLTCAATCSAKYAFQYEYKLPFKPKGSLALGNWIDDVLNVIWRHKLVLHQPHDSTDALAYADRTFEEAVEKKVPEWDLKVPIGVAKKRCLGAIGTYLADWYKRMEPVEVQPWVELPPGEIGVLGVRGRADLVTQEETGLWVVDHKLRAKSFYDSELVACPPDSSAIIELRRNLQMNLYAAAMAKRGQVPVGIRWIGLVWTAEPSVQAVEVRMTRQMVTWAEHAAKGAARVIESGERAPNPLALFCSKCDFSEACSRKYGDGLEPEKPEVVA